MGKNNNKSQKYSNQSHEKVWLLQIDAIGFKKQNILIVAFHSYSSYSFDTRCTEIQLGFCNLYKTQNNSYFIDDQCRIEVLLKGVILYQT